MGRIRKKKSKKYEENKETKPIPPADERLADELKSSKSLDLLKNEPGIKHLSKINKAKLKRNVLIKKIAFVTKKSENLKNIPKDVSPNDKLPSMSRLFATTANKIKVHKGKKKPIPKLSKRKQNLMEGVRSYKNVIKNKDFKRDPIGSVLQQVKLRFSVI